MEIEKLSISDLKSALDFVREDLQNIENKAKKNKISPETIPAYNEVKKTENDLYNKLLNLTRGLV